MFKGQPKGLFALALANTGERFGYYTMLAIFLLFLQAKFGFSAAEVSGHEDDAGTGSYTFLEVFHVGPPRIMTQILNSALIRQKFSLRSYVYFIYIHYLRPR